MHYINGPAATMLAFPVFHACHVHLSKVAQRRKGPENDRSVDSRTELCQWQTQLRYWKDSSRGGANEDEDEEGGLLTNSRGRGTTFVTSPPSITRGPHSDAKGVSQQVWERQKKSRKTDNTLEGTLLCAAEPTGQMFSTNRTRF